VRAFTHLIDPLAGVVHDVRKVTGRRPWPIHAYVANHAGAVTWRSLKMLERSLPLRSGGKGQSDVQARAGALGEAIERYCGTWQGDEPRVAGSLDDFGARAIHPKRYLLYSARQYRRREEWNPGHPPQQWVPVAFDPSAPTDWTPVWSLTEQRHKYLPSMYLYYGYPVDVAQAFCWADSNGCAAGNTREEAIVQGFLELVERDSVALWWYNRVQRPALELATLSSPYSHTLRAYYESLARELWILDITSDLGIPCFAAVSRRVGPGPEQILLGFGAHLDADLAAMRALTEMNQLLALVRTVAGRGRGLGQTLDAWLAEATIATHPYLQSGRLQPAQITDFPRVVHRDLRDDVRWCQRLVERRGMELLVLDQTRPDINAAVVRVIVPGLRPFRARFAPGRLYDVPVALGWLAKPRPEADLNPVEVFA
jgi:ribosomal protein S12 methylthiotransferase accessory factor